MQRLPDLRTQHVGTPAAAIGHAGMHERRARADPDRRSHGGCHQQTNHQAGEHLGASHSSNQSMAKVAARQNAVTGRALREIFTPMLRATETAHSSPPTNASVCAGATNAVSSGCHASPAVPNRFQPSPSGSESEAAIYVALVRTNDRLKAIQNASPSGTMADENEVNADFRPAAPRPGSMHRAKSPGSATRISVRNAAA